MNKQIKWLSILAIIQVALLIGTFMSDSGLSSQEANTALIEFNKDKIDKIIIKGVDDEEVVISKDGDQWLTSGSFPADQDKVERILDRLNKLEHGLSLATTDAAIKRFRVSENDFERYLQLEINGNTVAEMYLGTGAGARRIHVRPANEAAVYVVEFSSYELSSEISDWQDKTVLHIVADDVTSIEANDITLLRNKSADDKKEFSEWASSDLEEGETLDQEAINKLLRSLCSLNFKTVLGKDLKPEYGLEDPLLNIALTHNDDTRSYRFGQYEDSDDYVLKISARPEYFEISSYNGKNIIDDSKKEAWVQEKPEEESKEIEGSNEGDKKRNTTKDKKVDKTDDSKDEENASEEDKENP